jgi:multidrug efflux pump subunit AcrB
MPFENKLELSDLDKIYVQSLTGRLIPLKQLATLEFKKAPSIINRYNFDRTALITANLIKGASLDEVLEPVIKELDQYNFPKGYSYHIGGELESREDTFGGMVTAIIIALIGIFAILVLQFRSFLQPVIIFIAIPFAVVGMIWALFITNNDFCFTAFIGLISLVGIVINNSIILVDYTNQLIRNKTPLIEAIKIACETRFTPILLTSLTTIGGLLPLTLTGGTLWAPMGWTIIGGLITSTFLTLVFVPVLYSYMTKKVI